MSKLTNCLASLALTFSLIGCATSAANRPTLDPAREQPLEVEPGKQAQKLDRSAVRAKLAERRAVTLENFLAYREARVYPVSRGLGEGFHHVWMDDSGNLCAAATLISRDLGRDRAIAIGAANNGMKLADATSGPAFDWILTSGLAQHEIVAIQVPGWEQPQPESIELRQAEIQRLYNLYVDVERQLHSLERHNLELAVDALMAKPELARAFLAS